MELLFLECLGACIPSQTAPESTRLLFTSAPLEVNERPHTLSTSPIYKCDLYHSRMLVNLIQLFFDTLTSQDNDETVHPFVFA